jgi:hypothetical protein
MGAVKDRMVRQMQLRRLAPGTQQIYGHAVTQLARHYGRSPDQIDADEVRDYLLHLLTVRRVNWSTVNSAAAGIRFFCTETLGRDQIERATAPSARRWPTPAGLRPEGRNRDRERVLGGVDAHRSTTVAGRAAYAVDPECRHAARDRRIRHVDHPLAALGHPMEPGRVDREVERPFTPDDEVPVAHLAAPRPKHQARSAVLEHLRRALP